METGDRLVLNAASVREDYRRDFMSHRQALRSMAASRGVAFMSATTRGAVLRPFRPTGRLIFSSPDFLSP